MSGARRGSRTRSGVRLDHAPLVRRERALLLQNRIGDADLADVVHRGGEPQIAARLRRPGRARGRSARRSGSPVPRARRSPRRGNVRRGPGARARPRHPLAPVCEPDSSRTTSLTPSRGAATLADPRGRPPAPRPNRGFILGKGAPRGPAPHSVKRRNFLRDEWRGCSGARTGDRRRAGRPQPAAAAGPGLRPQPGPARTDGRGSPLQARQYSRMHDPAARPSATSCHGERPTSSCRSR